MPYKTPDSWMPIIAAAAALLGAFARWKESNMLCKPFSPLTFFSDMLISAFLGLMAFWVVMDLNQPESFAACTSAVVGNIGSRVFDILRALFFRKLKGDTVNDDKPEA